MNLFAQKLRTRISFKCKTKSKNYQEEEKNIQGTTETVLTISELVLLEQ